MNFAEAEFVYIIPPSNEVSTRSTQSAEDGRIMEDLLDGPFQVWGVGWTGRKISILAKVELGTLGTLGHWGPRDPGILDPGDPGPKNSPKHIVGNLRMSGPGKIHFKRYNLRASIVV